jgi:hypothetical protein
VGALAVMAGARMAPGAMGDADGRGKRMMGVRRTIGVLEARALGVAVAAPAVASESAVGCGCAG